MDSCQFFDGRHFCGEAPAGQVGLSVPGDARPVMVTVCSRHQDQLARVYGSGQAFAAREQPSEPAPEPTPAA